MRLGIMSENNKTAFWFRETAVKSSTDSYRDTSKYYCTQAIQHNVHQMYSVMYVGFQIQLLTQE